MHTIKRYRPDPAAVLIPKGATSCTDFEDFIGPVMVAETFSIDGRSFDYEWVWETPIPDDCFWCSPEGYEIVALGAEYEPETLLLLCPQGSKCGFYMGVELWIDPPHRGRGLAAELVLAMTQLLGKSPRKGQGMLGFSPAGYAAHRKAWGLAQARAQARKRLRTLARVSERGAALG